MARLQILVAVGTLFGCSSTPVVDASVNPSADASSEASSDVGGDYGADSALSESTAADTNSEAVDTTTVDSAPKKDVAADSSPPTYVGDDVVWLKIDESAKGARVILVDHDCNVTYNGSAIGKGDVARCTELFAKAVNPFAPSTPCPDTSSWGDVIAMMEMKDGKTYSRNIAKDWCIVGLPGRESWKAAIAVCDSAPGSPSWSC